MIKPKSSYHWYDRDGKAHHDAGLREARKLGLLPSPTTIMGVLNQPGLTAWKQNNILKAALDVTDAQKEGSDLDQLAKQVVEDLYQQNSQVTDRGTAIHLGAEQILKDEEWDTADQQLVALNEWAQSNVLDVRFTEEVLVNNERGYAGTMDALIEHREHGLIGIDYKSQNCKQNAKGDYKPAYYKTWPLQGAAYRECIDRELPFMSVVVNKNGPEIFEKRWDDEVVDKAFDAFLNLHAIWCWEKNYYPGEKKEEL